MEEKKTRIDNVERPLQKEIKDSSPSRRNLLVDYLRGILILTMIMAHFGTGVFEHGQMSWPLSAVYLGIVLNEIGHFAAPGFFLLSGYMNAKKYKGDLDIRRYFRRRFRTILVPYAAVTASYILWALLFHPQQLNLRTVLYNIFLFGIDAQLYFVPVLVQLYLLFPFLAKIISDPDKDRHNAVILFFATIAFHVFSGVLTYKGMLPYLYIRSSFTFWCPYFFWGTLLGFGYIRKGSIPRLKYLGIPMLASAAALIYYATIITIRPFKLLEFAYSHTRPSLMAYNAVCTWFILLLVLESPRISNRFVNWLGKNSLILFLWHQPVMRTLLKIPPVNYSTPVYQYVLYIPLLVFGTACITAVGNELWNAARDRTVRWLKRFVQKIGVSYNRGKQATD